jgi:hypothetical protein
MDDGHAEDVYEMQGFYWSGGDWWEIILHEEN